MPWQKYDQLLANLRDMKRISVAFSGGVDSSLLLQAAVNAVGRDHVLAVTADSETYPAGELTEAKAIAEHIGVRHEVIATSELAIPGYADNDANRCYYCKQGLFNEVIPLMKEKGYDTLVYGLIADDAGEHRPGVRAAKEYGVRGPLQEVGLYKNEVRFLAKELGLPNWDKPSYACLSSRVAYGEKITQEKLTQIEMSERFLHRLGIKQVRVRHHDRIARIEVEPQDLPIVFEHREAIHEALHEYGYQYITVDLAGYRSGSMNKMLNLASG